MKIIKLLSVQVVFFSLVFIISYSLKDYILTKKVLLVVLFVGLTMYLFQYFYLSQNISKAYIINLLGLFFFYEAMKILEYYMNLLPMYDEIPIISALATLIGIAFYLGLIILICHFANIKHSSKDQ